MPKDDMFGSPSARDPTAEWERTIEDASNEYRNIVKQVGKTLMNREVGSKKVPAKERLQEYEMARENPEWLSQYFIDSGATVEEMIQHAMDMEHKLRNG